MTTPASGQANSGVVLRQDLMDLAEEFDFSQFQFNADKILPGIQMPAVSGYWPVLPREARMKIYDTSVSPDGSFQRGQWEFTSDGYLTKEYGFEEKISLTSQLIWENFIDLEKTSTELCMQNLLMAREQRVSNAVFNTTTFSSSADKLTITNEWDDAGNATPYADVAAMGEKLRAKSGISKRAASLILTGDNIDYCLRTTEVKQSVQYTESVVTMPRDRQFQFLAQYFGVKEIIEVSNIFDASGVGKTFTAGSLWSNEFGMLAYLSPNTQSTKTLGLGRQPIFSRFSNDYLVETYAEDKTRCSIVRAIEYRGEKVNTDYGVLAENMKTTVSNGI
jgi:hypothetical protein